MSGNPNIGDAGVAAVAAAIKVAPRRPISSPLLHSSTTSTATNSESKQENKDNSPPSNALLPTLETLDVSSCQVGDAGAASLAIALRGNAGCIQCINLSHNCITDQGAIMLGRVLSSNVDGGIDGIPTFVLENEKSIKSSIIERGGDMLSK